MNPSEVWGLMLVRILDTSQGGGNDIIGQTGTICGMFAGDMEGGKQEFYPLVWGIHKQKRVSYS